MTHTNTQDSNYDWASTQYTDKEASLLVIIQENSRLPESDQLRYQQLWHKCEDETISDNELVEYQMLLSQLEDRNLKRIEVLMALARSRGNTLEEIIAELGINKRILIMVKRR